MLKFAIMLFKPWLNSSNCVDGGIIVLETALLFGNNTWIMRYTWLPNLSTYSLAVIRPWRVIMGPTEYCYTVLLPKPSQNPPRVSLSLLGIPDCRLRRMFSKRKLALMKARAWMTTHLTIARARFPLSYVHVSWSWRHRLRIWALLLVIRGLAVAALQWMLDLWSSRRTIFAKTGYSRWIFSSAVTSTAVVVWSFETMTRSFCHCWFLLMLHSNDSCMPT
jgi:hypothetical protein